VEYKDSFNYDESDEQQRKRPQHNPNDPYGLGAASPGDPYGLSSAPQDDPYSLQPREAAPDLGPKAKKKEPTDPQQKKDSEPQAPSSKSDTDQPEDKAKPLFGVSTPELEKHVGKSTDVQEAQADALAREVTAEPANDAQQKPAKAEIPSPSQSAAPHLPGLPTTGGKKLSKEDQQKFGKKVGDLSDVEIHKAPKAAKYLDAEAFTVGRRIYKGKNANRDTILHEIAHFSPNDKTTGKLRRKSSSDSWAEREKQRQIEERKAAERRRIAAEKEAAEKKRAALAKAAEERRVAAVKAEAARRHAEQLASKQNPQSTDKTQPHMQKIGGLKGLEAKALKYQEQERQAKLAKQANQPTQLKGLKALEAKALKYREQEKQAKLQKTVEQHPGIAEVLKQPFFKNALTFGAGLMSPALGASALAGVALIGTTTTQKQPTAQPAPQSAPQPEAKKEDKGFFGKALDFGKDIVKGAAKVGEKVLNTGESAINTVTNVLPIPQPLKDLANPIKLAKNVVKGATAIATAPQKAAGGLLDGAMSFGKDLFNGAKDLGKKALNTAGNAINGAKDLGSKALKGAVNLADSAIKTGTKLAKEFGEYAQKNPWEVAKMVTHGALDVLGFVPVFGAIADVANAGLYAAEGKYDMAAMSMLSAVPGVGDVLGPAAKAATLASKAIPTAAKVAKTLSKAEKVVNSPVGKAVTNGLPVAGTLATAAVQTATGNGDAAKSTLMNMGLPIVGKFGGKALGKAADVAQNPAAKAAINAASKTVSTGGKYSPAVMQGKDVADNVGKYQRGEIKAEDLVQSAMDLTTSTAGMKTADRMGRNSANRSNKSPKPEGEVPTPKGHPVEGTPGAKNKAEGQQQPQQQTQKPHQDGQAPVQQKQKSDVEQGRGDLPTVKKSPGQLAHEAHLQKSLPKSARVPVEVNPKLEGNTVQVHYVKDAKGRIADVHIQAGPKATPRDIELHARTVKSMKRYSGMSFHAQKLKDRFDGWVSKNGTPPVGSKAWEAKLEIQKLPNIIADRTKRLSSGDLTPQQRTKLEQEVTHLEHQLDGYKKDFKAMDRDPGKGFVAAKDKKEKDFGDIDFRKIFDSTSGKSMKGMSPQEIENAFALWKKDMASTAKVNGKYGEFNYGSLDPKLKQHHAISSNVDQNGTLDFTIATTDKEKRRQKGQNIGKAEETGADLFARMMIYHRGKVKRIQAHWTNYNDKLKDNFDSFKEKQKELGDEQAAKQTFTGRMSEKFGFDKVSSMETTTDKQGFEHIHVTFEQ
jgi:Domain of unknown function (DUF4157)